MELILDSILDCIGNTPLVRLKSLSNEKTQFLAKLESFNPGGSSKDRIAIPIINAAEQTNQLKPGGTIIEATSGNTGLALAFVAIQRGYKIILVIPDKMSPEKINILKTFGAKVVICPTEVEADDPKSYYSVAKKLAEEVPNSFWARQYWNQNNPKAHYNTTGPEIWKATNKKITHFVAGVGTGGTISGVGKFLKEKNPNIKIIAIDPIGSILAHYHKNKNTNIQAKGYMVEGVGEDIIPETVDFDVIDQFITVTDAESFHWARKIAKEEAMFVGGSSGLVLAGATKLTKNPKKSVIVLFLPDTGERYLSKIYNDGWMRANKFLPEATSIQEILNNKQVNLQGIKLVDKTETIADALAKFKRYPEIGQLAVKLAEKKHGIISRKKTFKALLSKKRTKNTTVQQSELIEQVAKIDLKSSIKNLQKTLLERNTVIVLENGSEIGIITINDLVQSGITKF